MKESMGNGCIPYLLFCSAAFLRSFNRKERSKPSGPYLERLQNVCYDYKNKAICYVANVILPHSLPNLRHLYGSYFRIFLKVIRKVVIRRNFANNCPLRY